MKRMMMTMVAMAMTVMSAMAMSYEQAREQAYYLTDKMAYELNLNDQQYNDAYEINLDYLLSVQTADDLYGSYLTYRNADLRYILHDWQWSVFCGIDYFMRPVSWIGGAWYFPIYRHYAHSFWYYDRPRIFWDYRGGHGHAHYVHTSFYAQRRPMWQGGMRGHDRSMVGRDTRNMHNGRIGSNNMSSRGTRTPGMYDNNTRGGNRYEGTRGHRSESTRGQYNESMRGQHSEATNGNQQSYQRGERRGSTTGNDMRSSSRPNMDNGRGNSSMPSRSTMGGTSSRGSYSGGSRGSMGSGSTRSSMSSSYSGGSSRGSMGGSSRGSMSGSSRGSMGGGSARGGRR